MSRSRKKVPISKDHRSGKWGKKQANRAVRRNKSQSLKGKEYKYTKYNLSIGIV